MGGDSAGPGAGALVEREPELAALGDLLTGAESGRGGLILIEASAGLGKSALVDRAVAQAGGRGIAVARGSGHELEQCFGWGVARSLFEPLLRDLDADDLADLMSGPAAAAAAVLIAGADPATAGPVDAAVTLSHALYWLTVRLAERAPLLLAVDDGHWLDDPSLRFLIYLSGRLTDLSVALLVTSRPAEGDTDWLVAHLAGRAMAVLDLQPLSDAGVYEVARARIPGMGSADAARCAALTAGNPLYLRELLVALAEHPADALPLDAGRERAAKALGRRVVQRLRRLPAAVRVLADAVAVLEEGDAVTTVAAVAGLPAADAAEAADQLRQGDLLRPDVLAFTHPLLRDAVYGQIPARARSASHRRAADVLAAVGAPAMRVSGHLLQTVPAGDPDVVRLLREAAHRAAVQGAPSSSERFLERALLEPPDPGVRVGGAHRTRRRQCRHRQRELGIDRTAAALALLDDPRRRAQVALQLCQLLHHRGLLAQACTIAESALHALDDPGDELAVQLRAAYLTSAAQDGGSGERARDQAAADMLAESEGASPAQLSLISKAMLLHLWAGGPAAESAPVARRLLANPTLLDGRTDPQALWHVGGALTYADDYRSAAVAIRLAEDRARRTGSIVDFAALGIFGSRLHLITGPLDQAIEEARTGLESMLDGGLTYLPAAGHSMICGLLDQGKLDEAADVLRVIDEYPPQPGYFGLWREMAAARLAAARGATELAHDMFTAAGRRYTAAIVCILPPNRGGPRRPCAPSGSAPWIGRAS